MPPAGAGRGLAPRPGSLRSRRARPRRAGPSCSGLSWAVLIRLPPAATASRGRGRGLKAAPGVTEPAPLRAWEGFGVLRPRWPRGACVLPQHGGVVPKVELSVWGGATSLSCFTPQLVRSLQADVRAFTCTLAFFVSHPINLRRLSNVPFTQRFCLCWPWVWKNGPTST